MDSVILYLALAGFSFVIVAACGIKLLFGGRAGGASLMRALDGLEAEVVTLNETMKLMDQYTLDYFSAMQDCGYGHLGRMRTSLERVLLACQALSKQPRNYRRVAHDILTFVWQNGGTGPIPTAFAEHMPDDADMLINWRATCQEILLNISEKVEKASINYHSIGRVPRRRRHPTSLLLQTLRDLL